MQNSTVTFFTHANSFCDNECESPNAVRDILAKSVDLIYVFSYKFLHVPCKTSTASATEVTPLFRPLDRNLTTRINDRFAIDKRG